MGWQRLFLATLGLSGLLTAAAAGQSDVDALREAKKRAAAAEARSETLRQEAANAEATADRLVARRAALGAEIDAASAQIATARARIAVISRRQRAQAALLGEANAPMLRLNALLQNMTRQPVSLLLARPGDRRDYVRLRAAMASIEPVIASRTSALRDQMEIQRELQKQERVAITALGKARLDLASRSKALAALESDSRGKALSLNADAAIEFERAIGQGERARDLVERIDADRESGQIAAELAEYSGPQPRLGGGKARSESAGAFILPARGRVVSGFGELNPTGYRERGIRLAVEPGARVVAPAAGKVTFAGRYRSFGNIVIVEHGNGWATLVTGIERLGVEAGSQVRQGSIIGKAGDEEPEIMVELRRNGRLIDIAALLG
ncbi:MAG TPA: peptidoglycan DD-metalloendopeptidase family protein [Sphingorhabdus sp.]|jgi:septal ring factor EnvC (AmiA/AmiB activator)|uniref:murein hydrolase activator EnvC family protein n=1 Tax=Sphingorhabdus sp. TaxID=1902408 RepID=UPI002BBD29AE|nr:peptidoglycan DD-metalloendopeptidase family protein [Sphingorhabdus sp.]HMT40253.1 peptidoglycan DD-metalloendopeptidase family protein [Sphingorhabdus sp.]HMU20877.1 peptidoglycan DD-metalloendopeptidase family protein [Sphingorhabdus sp.]